MISGEIFLWLNCVPYHFSVSSVFPENLCPTTHTLLGGLSADAVPVAAELTIDPVVGMAGRINYGIFAGMHVLIWRDASQPDITSVVIASDPTQANQVGGFTKYGSTVDVGGTDGNVWVSNQSLTSVTAFVLDIA